MATLKWDSDLPEEDHSRELCRSSADGSSRYTDESTAEWSRIRSSLQDGEPVIRITFGAGLLALFNGR